MTKRASELDLVFHLVRCHVQSTAPASSEAFVVLELHAVKVVGTVLRGKGREALTYPVTAR